MSLRFLTRRNDHSVFIRTSDDELVYLAHDAAPFTRYEIDLSDVDFSGEWTMWHAPKYNARTYNPDGFAYRGGRSYREIARERRSFMEWLTSILTNPYDIDEISWCDSCTEPARTDDGSSTDNGNGWACDDCINDHYCWCECCETHSAETCGLLDGDSVCQNCADNYYAYCDECDGYYHTDEQDEHYHEEGCEGCCDSPALAFSVRNDGLGMLSNDTRATITLPAGVIDSEGMSRIRRMLQGEGLWNESYLLDDMSTDWQTREGNFTKRFSRTVYKANGTKISQDVLSKIGTIAAEHSRSVDFSIELTRDLNLSAEDFYHEDSCWWTSHAISRCALKTNGGFGMRTFGESNTYGNSVAGRAWVMPLVKDGERMRPTFDTETPDAYVVFNGYGDLDSYTPARILSHMTGLTYRKISFDCEPMYVNSSAGYLVAAEDIASTFTNGSLYLTTDQHATIYGHEAARTPITTDEEISDALSPVHAV